MLIVSGPEESMGYVLAQAGTITVAQGVPGIVLRLVNGGKRFQTLRQQTGDTRRQGTAGTVIAVALGSVPEW